MTGLQRTPEPSARAWLTGGYGEAELLRQHFAGNKEEIDRIISRMKRGACPCCAVDYDIIEMECGHRACQRCIDNHHQCIPCALAM